MKITARAAQASFTVTDEVGNTVAEYSVDNMAFTTDISGLLKCVSQAAHLFKALDAEHRGDTATSASTQGDMPENELRSRARRLQDAVRRFKRVTDSGDLTAVQHDAYMALGDANSDLYNHRTTDTLEAVCRAAEAYMATFCQVVDKVAGAPRYVEAVEALRAAIIAARA